MSSDNLHPVALDILAHSPGIVIEGARQIGKITLAERIAVPNAIIMNLDHDQTLDAAVADPTGFVA